MLFSLGRTAKAAGDLQRAGEAFGRVYFEFPLGDFAGTAGFEFQNLPNVQPIAPGTQRFKLELGRAERLFGARQYTEARAAFVKVKGAADDDDRDARATCASPSATTTSRSTAPRKTVCVRTSRKASRQGEALYFHALNDRALGDRVTYERTLRRVVEEFPTESWAEEALNNLATDQIVRDDDLGADGTLRELYAKYPRGQLFGARGLEDWLAVVSRASLRGDRAVLRTRGRRLSPIRLPPGVVVLVGPRPRSTQSQRARRSAVLARHGRLPQYLLRPFGDRRGSRAGARPPRIVVDAAETADGTAASSRRAALPSLLPPPPNEPLIRALLRHRRLRAGDERAAVCAAGVGGFSGPAGHAGLDPASAGANRIGHGALQSASRIDHHDEARLSAVHGGRRRRAAARRADGHLSARVLGSDQEVLAAPQARSVPRRRAHGAGIDLRARHPVARRRLRPDAAHAGHRAASTRGG